MSEPIGSGIKMLSEWEYEALQGRLAALELLAAQTWVGFFAGVAPDVRETLKHNMAVALEQRFDRMNPIAQRVAVETMDGIISSALHTCEVLEG